MEMAVILEEENQTLINHIDSHIQTLGLCSLCV